MVYFVLYLCGIPLTMGVFKATGKPLVQEDSEPYWRYIWAGIFWPLVAIFWLTVSAWVVLVSIPQRVSRIFLTKSYISQAVQKGAEKDAETIANIPHGRPLFSEEKAIGSVATSDLRIPHNNQCCCIECYKGTE